MFNTPIDFSGSAWDGHLARVHIQPSGEDVVFNRVVEEWITAGKFNPFADAYRLQTGSVLVYHGLTATRRMAEGTVKAQPVVAEAVEAANSAWRKMREEWS